MVVDGIVSLIIIMTKKQNAYSKNLETHFALSAERTKVNRKSSEKNGGKYETVTGQLA